MPVQADPERVVVPQLSQSVNSSSSRKKKRHTKPKQKFVILGDSLLKGTSEILHDINASVLCIPGATASSLENVVSEWSPSENVEKVILSVGGNDLSNAIRDKDDLDVVVGSCWSLLEKAEEKFPNAQFTFSGILRRSQFSNYVLGEVNNALAWMCQRKNVRFVNPRVAIKNNHYAKDGTHLNKSGTNALASLLKNLCVTPPTKTL